MPGSICIMSLSPIADDPRVRRQCEAFDAAGWRVTALGLPGATSSTPHWTIHELSPEINDVVAAGAAETGTTAEPYSRGILSGIVHAIAMAIGWHEMLVRTQTARHQLYSRHPQLRILARIVTFFMVMWLRICAVIDLLLYYVISFVRDVACLMTGRPLEKKPRAAFVTEFKRMLIKQAKHGPWVWLAQAVLLRFSWRTACKIYFAHPIIRSFYMKGLEIKADIYLANDWHMLPVAIMLADHHKAKFAYDTHEYALEEYRYKWIWRWTKRPMIYQLEKQAMQHACVVSAVSPGIAQGLKKDYRTSRIVHSIRNVPPRHHALPFHPTGARINVLFHGIIAPDRGLEECVRSVQYWRTEFHFQMRGPFSSPEFEQTLRGLVQQYGVGDRVHFLPKVPMTEMVRYANEADVGISTPPKTSKHNIFALPNKLFEYVQAGLALAICDLPDMAPIVTANDCGVLIREVTPEYIAEAINSLTREKIDYYKRQSQKTAETLNWETEQTLMLQLYERALTEAQV